MNNKKTQASHEREILERVRTFVRIDDLDYFYGFSQADIARLRSMLLNLTQNTETAFPDFYGLTHCVELFRVSSSKESKKAQSRRDKTGIWPPPSIKTMNMQLSPAINTLGFMSGSTRRTLMTT